MQGASPLASPGAGRGRGTGSVSVSGTQRGRALLVAGSPCRYGTRRGACPLGRLPTPPLACLLAPIPPAPHPGGKGEIFSFLMQGASPLASPGAGRGAALARRELAAPSGALAFLVAGSPCRRGTRRGACPLGRRLAMPLWYPAGGLPSWSPVRPAAMVPGGGLAVFVACLSCL